MSKKCIKNKRLGPDSDSLGTRQIRLCMQKTVSKFGKVDAFQLLSKLAVNAPYSALLSAVLFFLFILSRAADISECVSDTVSKRTRDGPPRQAYSNSLDEEYASRANDGTKNISIYRY